MPSHRSAMESGLLLIGAIASCAPVTPEWSEPLVSARWASATACPAGPAVPATASDSATRAAECAEAFLARNGYTQDPPNADSVQIAFESLELWGPSLRDILTQRRGMLQPKAYGVCHGEGDAYTVVFQYAPTAFGGTLADAATRPNGRGVTMDGAYAGLRMQHQEFRLAAVDEEQAGCRRLSTR